MDTFIALLTPPGKAAIATLALRGPRAWDLTRALFSPKYGQLPDEPTPGRHWFGKLGREHADDAILAVKEHSIELHCHGGLEVVRWLTDLFVESGAVAVPWQDFVDNGALLNLLARAPTTRTASILLDQINGAWEHVTPDQAPRLRELIPLGKHLVEPWKIVLAGAPNAGKSSLMNALAGYTRSIVAPTPGTTRDVVTTRIAIDGWPVELIDTAGLRETPSSLERQGIERATQAAKDADLRLWLLDGSAEPVHAPPGQDWKLVINKVDLPPAWNWDDAVPSMRLSARSGAGVPELCDWISRTLVPVVPSPGQAVPCLQEHADWISANEPRT